MIALVAALGVLSVAARFDNHQLLWVDRRIADLVYAPHHVELFRDISKLGSTRFSVTLAVVASVWVWRRCRPLAVLYPTAVLGGLLANVILKVVIDRARPSDPLTGTALKSFPSGHTIQTVVALGMLAPVVYALTDRRLAAIVTTVLSALGVAGVGLSRVALGAHWPSDIVGGVLVGILVLIAAEVALYRLPTRWLPPCSECPVHLAWGVAPDPRRLSKSKTPTMVPPPPVVPWYSFTTGPHQSIMRRFSSGGQGAAPSRSTRTCVGEQLAPASPATCRNGRPNHTNNCS